MALSLGGQRKAEEAQYIHYALGSSFEVIEVNYMTDLNDTIQVEIGIRLTKQ